jgi:hypothetical protein
MKRFSVTKVKYATIYQVIVTTCTGEPTHNKHSSQGKKKDLLQL